jgi:hypothetical protein
MALSRQGSLFGISEDSITRALGGDTSPQAVAVSGSSTAAEAETLESDGDGFGAEQANARANQSEFSEKDPRTAAAAAEKWRRDVNSPLNIGGGGGALYTADKNPFSDGDNDDAANDALGEMVEQSQQSLKREREELQRQREQQFASMMRDDYGVDMSADEWRTAADNFKDPKKRAASLRKTQQEMGWTDQQAQAADSMAGRIFAIMNDPNLTPQQQREKMRALQMENPQEFSNGLIRVERIGRNDLMVDKAPAQKTTLAASDASQGLSFVSSDNMQDMATTFPGAPLKGADKTVSARADFAQVAPDTPQQPEQKLSDQPQVTASVDRQVSSTPRPSAAALSC